MNNERQCDQSTTAERFLTLSRVGAALMSELDEARLLHLIAQAACDLTGAAFAAFSLRPMDESGQPLVPSEGQLFHLAAVVGVTDEQEAVFRRMPLGGEGLLAPIFRQGVPVLAADALAHLTISSLSSTTTQAKDSARKAAEAYAQGQIPSAALPSLGVPQGHPVVRSFLGAPLLDRAGEVRGGLLLGHTEPGQFTEEDQTILVGLASQAAVALENARLYRMAHMRAQQLDMVFDSISDGVMLLDGHGAIVRENRAARSIRTMAADSEQSQLLHSLLYAPAQAALAGEREEQVVQVPHGDLPPRAYLVTAQPLHAVSPPLDPPSADTPKASTAGQMAGAVVVWHDQTEQREQAAQAQAKQLEAIIEAITDAVVVLDLAGNPLLTNDAARTLLTRTLPPDYIERSLAEQFTQMVLSDEHGQPLPLEAWPASRILAGEVLTSENVAELSMTTRDGHLLYTHMTGGPLYDTAGAVRGAVIIIRDVTERQRAEQERERYVQQLHLQARLIDLAHDAILVRDPTSRVLSWNRGAEELYGWTAEQAQGQVTHHLLQTRLPISLQGVDHLLEQHGQWEGQLIHSTHDGVLVTVESRQVLMRDKTEQPWAILEINRNITRRVQLEHLEREAREEAETQRALLQLILDELPSSVYLVRGTDARLILANRTAKTLWGAAWPYNQSMRDFLSQNSIRLYGSTGQPLPPEQWATLRAVWQRETVRQHQETIHRANGSDLPVLVNAVALGTTGRLPRLPEQSVNESPQQAEPLALVVHQDIAALKEVEYLKDEFIGIAAHELRNPVAALTGFAEMLKIQTARGRGPALADWQLEALDEIEQASKRLIKLTEELLDVTRLQAGQLHLQCIATDLVALLQRMVTRLQATTQRSPLSLLTSTAQMIVFVDPVRIEQVLSNLLSNAIKYSPQGGAIDVRIQEQQSQKQVLISVQDSGMGIPQSQHAKIFSRFTRADNVREAGISGTGLGLYLCRELMELHGGHIWFESEEGTGTTFFFTLPYDTITT